MADEQQNPNQNLEDIATSIPEAHGEGNSYQSLATLSNAEILSQVGTGPDPLAGFTNKVHDEEQIPLNKRIAPPHMVSQMSMTADPKYSDNPFQLGDRVYHQVAKKEGIVKDVAASGRVQIQIGKEKFWVQPRNIVKLK